MPMASNRSTATTRNTTGSSLSDAVLPPWLSLNGSWLHPMHPAKIHLESWASKDVFEAPSHASRDGRSECRGNINVSGSSGSDAAEIPGSARPAAASWLPSSSGSRPTTSARSSRLPASIGSAKRISGRTVSRRTHTGVDAWVAVFMDKVCQIEQRHCGAWTMEMRAGGELDRSC